MLFAANAGLPLDLLKLIVLIIDFIKSVNRINTETMIERFLSQSISYLISLYYFFCDDRNPNEPQDEKLRLSKERNRFKSVNWEPYDKKQRKYMEIGEFRFLVLHLRRYSQRLNETTGSKPKMKSQFRAHRMAVLLQLLPELQRTGQHDVQQGHGILTPEGLETAGTGSGSALSLPAWVNGSYIDVTKERSTPSGTKEVTCVVPQPHTPTASPSTSNATTTVNNGSASQGSQAGNSGSVTAISDSTVYSTALSVTIGKDNIFLYSFLFHQLTTINVN